MAAVPSLKRQEWEDADRDELIRLWNELGSIFLISVIMGRAEGSVQTEASRIELPRRTEEKGQHRKKWDDEKINELRASAKLFRNKEGKILIIDVANATGRSVDAIVSKLAKDYETRDDLRYDIYVPRDVNEIKRLLNRNQSPDDNVAIDRRKVPQQRRCLNCERPFWSESAGMRLCTRCKADNEYYD